MESQVYDCSINNVFQDLEYYNHRPDSFLPLADEPTENLDQHTADQIYALVLELNQKQKTSFIVATHDPILAGHMDRILHL